MASYNRVILIGNLTRDVEVRVTQTGLSVGKVGLAVNERVKKGNDYVDETMFVDCTLFGKSAEVAAEYLSKGSNVFFEGRLKLDQWEKDGVKHSKHTVIVDKMQLLGSKQGGEQQSRGKSESYKVPPRGQAQSEPEYDDSEIPF